MTEAILSHPQTIGNKSAEIVQSSAPNVADAIHEPSRRTRSYFQLAYRQFIATVMRAARRRMHRGNWKGACALLRLAGRCHRDPRLLARLGYAAIRADDHPLAIVNLRAAASLSPGRAQYHVRLGSVYLELGFPVEARACVDRALEAEPTSPHPYVLLAELCAATGDRKLQLEHLQKALALSRSLRAVSQALLQLAEAYTDRASRKATTDCCLRAVAIQPQSSPAYLKLALAGFYDDVAHPHVKAAEQLLRDPRVSTEDKRSLHFALGLVYDQHARWDEAFSHFRRGNALALRARTFRSREPINDAKRRIAVFTAARIEEFARHGSNTTVPIFVIGMPRSGTTLIEQILDSHKKVHGLGESMELLQITQWLPARLSWTRRPYPECAEFLGADLVRQISDDFLARMVAAAAGAPRAVTKRPNDFWEVGLIHILFPKAKIIHCRRDPRDTCLSCYMQDFRGIAFASRLDHLASYYAQYERMMHHWRSVLKPGIMYELQYEHLVQDPEGAINAVLRFCELERDESCFEFFKNDRAVHTASTWQVRQPIYQHSVGRWRNYRRFLRPLGQLIVDRKGCDANAHA
ncbi:MAG TPA: sulfotransferase [Pirellulales bacterium]|nr:sulfotransferase [Pirellulales bacterium]